MGVLNISCKEQVAIGTGIALNSPLIGRCSTAAIGLWMLSPSLRARLWMCFEPRLQGGSVSCSFRASGRQPGGMYPGLEKSHVKGLTLVTLNHN